MNKIIIPAKTLLPIRTEDHFYSQANTLRKHFDERFRDPLSTRADRFVWDYWLVPDQYKLLRTPADSFFPKKIFTPFLQHLLNWGRANLGCQMISHPWLSLYIDGCYQSLHSDVPHGPWSFVYSLTPWKKRNFKGGETLVAKPRLLNYFSEYSHHTSDEKHTLFEQIEPRFNRLTLFDPRYPHGVNPLSGEDDLRKSRLVIHGWFTEPRPMIEGALNFKKAIPSMDLFALTLMDHVQKQQTYGLLSLKLKISAQGDIQNITVLCGHLIDSAGNTLTAKKLKALLKNTTQELPPFPKSSGSTLITLPLEFKK